MRKLENGNVVLETSTSIWPIACCGTYDGQPCDFDTLLDGDRYDDTWAWSSDGDHEIRNWMGFDFGKWKEAIRKELNDLLQNEFPTSTNRFGVWIGPVEATEISSPREYNFTTDCALLDVEVQPDFAGKALAFLSDARDDDTMRRRMDMWIEDHWKSCDGFTSWMPESWDDFVSRSSELDECIDGDKEMFQEAQIAGAILTLLTVCSDAYSEGDCGFGPDGEIDFLTEDLAEGLMENYCLDEFMPTWRFSELAGRLSAAGVEPVDFGKERNRMNAEWDAYAKGLGGDFNVPDKDLKAHVGELRKLDGAAEEQDALLIEWAKSKPASQEEFNALGKLRKFIEKYGKGE